MHDNSYSKSYAAAGVDVEAGYRAVELMKPHVGRTKIPGVLEGIGGFGGLFMPRLSGYKEPVLVSGTDGVGTKIRIAQEMDKHSTIGIDAVAMCVNDIICTGAAPMFFLDYLAVGKNIPERIEQIIKGIADGCVAAGCALIGGETAEHPGTMPEDDYDIGGFAVGIVDRENILDKNTVRAGDAIVGIASAGVHSNGFSLIRKILNDTGTGLNTYISELGRTVGEEILTPTRIYVKPILRLLDTVSVKSIGHITGGGFFENIPRILPQGLCAVIEKSKLQIPPVFNLLRSLGGIPERDMFGTFNMGVGMALVLPPQLAGEAVRILNECGETAFVIGSVQMQMQTCTDGLILA
ncbi:MAG: phosphoribosylformylglycinamidine cyclo-ligase [Oscillospiraceae bacterium]|nr:phosphoribosylformylglycinamidine cyclo-ligase [Oscillospiraceae bacterium]